MPVAAKLRSKSDRPSGVRRTRPSNYFYRACAATLRAHVNKISPERAARDLFDHDPVTEILLKAATNPAMVGTPAWAGALAATSIEDVVMEISSVSAAAALTQRGLQLDFGEYGYIKAPGRIVDPNDGGSWISEGAPITVRAQRITSGALLEPRKLIVISGFTAEIIAQSNIEAVARAIVSEGMGLKLDATMFDANAGSASRPPGILFGIAGLTPTAGGGLAALEGDLKQLMTALVSAGAGRDPVIITHPSQALTLSLLAGPKFDIPVLRSSGIAAGTVIMIESSSFASAMSSVPEFEIGQYPLLTYDDPAPPADPMTGTPTRSAFQTDSIGLRTRLICSWGFRAPHIAWLSGATW
jgi:hypothetical protein